MKKVIIWTILITTMFLFLGHKTWESVKGDFPVKYKDKYTVKETDKPKFDGCEPYIKIIEPKSVVCDCNPYKDKIDSLNKLIDIMIADNQDFTKLFEEKLKCYKDKCISFNDVNCE